MSNHSVRKINGIGPVTADQLKTYNITNVGELAQAKASEVRIRSIERHIANAKSYIHRMVDNAAEVKHDEPKHVMVSLGFSNNTTISAATSRSQNLFTPLLSASSSSSLSASSSSSLSASSSSSLSVSSSSSSLVSSSTLSSSASIPSKTSIKSEEIKKELQPSNDLKKENHKKDQINDETEELNDTEQQPIENRYLISSHSWYEQQVLIPRALNGDNNDDILFRPAIIYELSVEPHSRISFLMEWHIERSPETNQNDLVCAMSYSPQIISALNPRLPLLIVQIKKEDWQILPNKDVLLNVLWETNTIKQFHIEGFSHQSSS